MAGKQPKRKDRPGVDRYGRTPLHQAAADGDVLLSDELLKNGANPNAQDDNGWTPLHFAAQAVCAPVAELLIKSGAKTELRDSFGNSPLWRAVFSSREDGSVIILLLAAGADPLAKNTSDVSPVALARLIANYDVRRFFDDLP